MTDRMSDHRGEGKKAEPSRPQTVPLSASLLRREPRNRKSPSKSIPKRQITNLINWLHFLQNPLLVHLKDRRFGNELLSEAIPQSCREDFVSLRWPGRPPLEEGSFDILNLIVSDGLSIVLIPVTEVDMKDKVLVARLPEKGFSLGKRAAKRYPSRDDIQVEISQSGFNARGTLIDFSSRAFRFRAWTRSPDSFHWFRPDRDILVRLQKGSETVYQGVCRFVRQTMGARNRDIVLGNRESLSPASSGRRHKRNPRRSLSPSAILTFQHPFSGEPVQRDLHDISMTGFSVWESMDEGVLLPGMVLPEARIIFFGNTTISIRTKVVHRKDNSARTRCGLAFLDMGMGDVRHLSRILANISDPHLFVSREPDMNALWSFLFQTGFLYPKKYEILQEYRESLKETFRKLYRLHPDIADHFLYQKDGKIYGHLSMVRAYDRGWVLHHLAALRMGSLRVALALLTQAVEYFEGIHRFPSMRMDYLIFYYRPENRFPNLIGEFADSLGNPRGCSQDLFAYLEVTSSGSSSPPLPAGWSLEAFTPSHRATLEQHYAHLSGGLLLDVLLGDSGEREAGKEIEEAYRAHGMKREVRVYSLLHQGRLKAVLWQSRSDLGLNLSELLNAIKVVVVDAPPLPWEILNGAMRKLALPYTMDRVPALVFPASYATEQKASARKHYMMWIMDVQYGRAYIDYMEKRIRHSRRMVMLFGWLRKALDR